MKDALRDVTTGEPQTTLGTEGQRPRVEGMASLTALPPLAMLPAQCYQSPLLP